MPDHYPAIDIVAPSLTTELGETFFFGASLHPDALPCVIEIGGSRGVLGIVCLFNLCHAVSIRASRLRFPILTRAQGAKGRPTAQETLCWSCP